VNERREIFTKSKMSEILIITFYEFKPLRPDMLAGLRDGLKKQMRELSIKGTIILAEEGFNATVSGRREEIEQFISFFERAVETKLEYKSSHFEQMPFRRIDVKIKPEIVTLKQRVDVSLGVNTHVDATEWNRIISDPETIVLDTRNDYEFRTGSFHRAINPETEKFSDLPAFAADNFDPAKHKKVAMFCTGGIRCEKFAPYMKQLGFKEVYQLKGGILKYLEDVSDAESLWHGECFVFDGRISVDSSLKKGQEKDLSQEGE